MKQKNPKSLSIIYFISSILAFVCAGVWYGNENMNPGFAGTWFLIGIVCAFLGITWLMRYKKEKDENNKD